MTPAPPLKPWRGGVRLKGELRNKTLPLSEFAADLYEAALPSALPGRAPGAVGIGAPRRGIPESGPRERCSNAS